MKRRLVVAAIVCAWDAPSSARADDTVTYEVRQQVIGALLPTHDFDVTGYCATGTGVAPASVYTHGGSGRGAGLGIGIGGRVGYDHVPKPPSVADSTFWAFRVAVGLDLDLLYARVPVGIGDLSGKLCARVKSDGAEVQMQGSSVLMARAASAVGVELGLKTGDDRGAWRGVVLGAAWAPAVTLIQPWTTGGDAAATFLGVELTLDFVTWRTGAGPPPSERAAVVIALPTDDRGPAIVSLSFGVLWH